MRIIGRRVLVLGLATAAGLLSAAPVSALPVGPMSTGPALMAQFGQDVPTIQVRSRGGDVAAGIIGGMLLGGFIASQRPYYYDYPPPYPYYPAYRGYAHDPAIAYCLRRFRSYDPYSMTYLGHDGFRHSCP